MWAQIMPTKTVTLTKKLFEGWSTVIGSNIAVHTYTRSPSADELSQWASRVVVIRQLHG